jgi:CRP/FNR family transcriptional regulator, cyclic AMP receptor protein
MLTSVDRLLFVRRVPIFKELRDDFIVRLASVMNELSFPANHAVFRQGEEGRSLYIVVSGRVKVHIGDKKLAEVDKGKYFGEMAVFDTQPRSASATTLEPCDCLELTQEQLYDAIEETPEIAVNIIRELSRLIRKLNENINVGNSESH